MLRTFPDAHPLIEEIAISIDAASAQTYAVNRGGNYERLLENLAFISELRRNWNISSFRLNFVVQANNFREMPDFVELGLQLGVDRILFQKLVNANNAGMSDFENRAVHLAGHPDHKEFRELLLGERFIDPIVDLYTISDQKGQRRTADSDDVDVSVQTPLPSHAALVPENSGTNVLSKPDVISVLAPPAATQDRPRQATGLASANDEIKTLVKENAKLRNDCAALKRALSIYAQGLYDQASGDDTSPLSQ